MVRLHATCVLVAGCGVLLRGASGAGKSDLALRLIDGGARLIADDQTELREDGGRLLASPPEVLAGLIEVRGLGILRLPHQAGAELRLAVDLVAAELVERAPRPARVELLGLSLPLIALAPFEASAAAKVRLAVRAVSGDIMPADDR